jgi:phospholipid-transporting ATPase
VPKQVPLGPDQVLLRGAQIRNTPWVYGIAVFTGHETKLMRNATWVSVFEVPAVNCGSLSFVRAAPIKRTAVERQVNVQIVFLFILLLSLSVGSTVGSSIRSVS